MIPAPYHPDTNDHLAAEESAIDRRQIDRLECLTRALCDLRACQAYLSAMAPVDPAAIEYHLQLREA